ncbi:hypothetical protein BO94DRAFT_603727 [Aspergillus sclerotioniger CBS 115572]|uniref:F-box domain-containing protein n=1 Tax=Aspergillus sclerotioniger CBS 115572 TaxID=1450535 RepID=A0A317VYH8_9EURO|nr:hypothetical protein BO94DRAFT_603727 [Aspergillus sclerotioniger CBS 115572]PWY78017.1 hypothetical protein BO94DRAFT_603727 [Aspergillus sclerotioniger CBS 115572]
MKVEKQHYQSQMQLDLKKVKTPEEPSRKKRKKFRESPPSTHRMSLRSSPKITMVKVPPPEIVMIIMDLLDAPQDMDTLLKVFPRWKQNVPETYWRHRFIKDLMLEDEELPGLDDLDWKHVYLEMDLADNSLLGFGYPATDCKAYGENENDLFRSPGKDKIDLSHVS